MSSHKKIVHMAAHVNKRGGVSALCYQKTRAINLNRASWTNRSEAVTCQLCRHIAEQAPPDSIKYALDFEGDEPEAWADVLYVRADLVKAAAPANWNEDPAWVELMAAMGE